jgi:hypothetical protein
VQTLNFFATCVFVQAVLAPVVLISELTESREAGEGALERLETRINDFGHSGRSRLLIDRPQRTAGTIRIPGNETTPISARTNVSEAPASTPLLRVQGYCLS